jgi:hypothetical protein
MSVARQLQLLAPDFRTLIHRSQFLGEFAQALFDKRIIAPLTRRGTASSLSNGVSLFAPAMRSPPISEISSWQL